MDEDLDVDVGVAALQVQDCGVEASYRLEVVVLGVDHPYQGSNLPEDGVHVEGEARVVEDVDLAGEIPYLELHE